MRYIRSGLGAVYAATPLSAAVNLQIFGQREAGVGDRGRDAFANRAVVSGSSSGVWRFTHGYRRAVAAACPVSSI
ncbi:MAG: hypothetical protein NVSMB21_14060 [Vulcanimicrobiaceae bacterium]